MGMNSHKKEQFDLLRAVLQRKRPDLLPLLYKLGREPLSPEEREHIKSAIAEELMSSGIGEKGEINQRGIDLDELIGLLSKS